MEEKIRLPWDQGKFREIYAEARGEGEQFMEAFLATLRECNANSEFPVIRAHFEEAHAHYKKGVGLANQLSIMMGRRLRDKPLNDWTWQQGADNALVGALIKFFSENMNNLLGAYSPFLRHAQFSAPPPIEEMDAS